MFVPIVYHFSTDSITNYRTKFHFKICYRPVTKNLLRKTLPTMALTNRLFKNGKFLRVYKNCNKFYLLKIVKNIKLLPPNNEFKNTFLLHRSFMDFNRVLYWRFRAINPLFNLKKLKNKKLLYYVKPERRAAVLLYWLKSMIIAKKQDYNNNTYNLFNPLVKFICIGKNSHELDLLKLRIYRIRLLRG